MKATAADYDYLIDQLSNKMTTHESSKDFINDLVFETSFAPEDLSEIWRLYLAMDAKTAFDMNNYNWYDFIKAIISPYRVM